MKASYEYARIKWRGTYPTVGCCSTSRIPAELDFGDIIEVKHMDPTQSITLV